MYIALVVCLCVFQVPIPGFNLWSTDVAPEVLHPRPMWRDAATREGRRCPRVPPRLATWLFIFFKPTRADAALTRAWISRIGWNRPYRPKRPIQAEIQKKKKKRCKTHRLTNLKTQTPLRPSHFVQHSQTASLTPSLISLLCVLTVLRPSSLFSVFRALCVSAVCCFSLQVCSLCSFLEFLFFVFYNFSLSNCLEKYLWIWKFMCLTTGCLCFFLFQALCVSGSLCENLKIFLSVFRALYVSGWVLCFFSCFFNCCGS